ncbi:nuclease-related domain-containing protein [Pseudalkalibacillus berkeleyi]|uniref:NERD domain-containing protein n=1 Tax=Pseudalkalibacillus berkeleyi TaxID=1069813 RepID=A0ABS9H4N2_9BACL|nr:nuclease-related domain-containing protein [Pseudalkalibacillus berkeleyi]MCF6138640.1 NERD domain-containing protein [Pseudalkalibacillus berkeleyi]
MRRITPDHPARPIAEGWLETSRSGEWGERSLDYYLSFLGDNKYLIFDGTRLSSGKYFFQMDTLLVHPTFFILMEVKNLAGSLLFDTDQNQLIQQIADKEVIHKDPIQQVEHQHFQLIQWLRSKGFSDQIPINSFVVVANNKAKIIPNNNEELLRKKVIRNTKILDTINDLHATYKQEWFSAKELINLKRKIIQFHTPYHPDILSKLNIPKEKLTSGVQCPKCLAIPMQRARSKWICPQCKTISPQAHLDALRDYFLLCGKSISNQQLRSFLQIPSRTTSYRFLSSLNLKHMGTGKNRSYILSSLWPKYRS